MCTLYHLLSCTTLYTHNNVHKSYRNQNDTSFSDTYVHTMLFVWASSIVSWYTTCSNSTCCARMSTRPSLGGVCAPSATALSSALHSSRSPAVYRTTPHRIPPNNHLRDHTHHQGVLPLIFSRPLAATAAVQRQGHTVGRAVREGEGWTVWMVWGQGERCLLEANLSPSSRGTG